MRLVDAISTWFESKHHGLQANLFVFRDDSEAMSNGRKVYGFFFDKRKAHWLGDVFESHVELRKTDGNLDYLERLEPGNPDFFTQLEGFLREPR